MHVLCVNVIIIDTRILVWFFVCFTHKALTCKKAVIYTIFCSRAKIIFFILWNPVQCILQLGQCSKLTLRTSRVAHGHFTSCDHPHQLTLSKLSNIAKMPKCLFWSSYSWTQLCEKTAKIIWRDSWTTFHQLVSQESRIFSWKMYLHWEKNFGLPRVFLEQDEVSRRWDWPAIGL